VNPNEVKDTKYVTAEELKEMFKDSSLKFTPWFKLICETYLFKWWTNVDEAEKLFREDEIKRMV
jgi:isopentenyl-diphosphate delta-isomerase